MDDINIQALELWGTVCKLCNLKPNWDSYGALPMNEASINLMVECLYRLYHVECLPDYIVPTNTGWFVFGWRNVNGFNVEIEYYTDGRIDLCFHKLCFIQVFNFIGEIEDIPRCLDYIKSYTPKSEEEVVINNN